MRIGFDYGLTENFRELHLVRIRGIGFCHSLQRADSNLGRYMAAWRCGRVRQARYAESWIRTGNGFVGRSLGYWLVEYPGSAQQPRPSHGVFNCCGNPHGAGSFCLPHDDRLGPTDWRYRRFVYSNLVRDRQ